MFIIFRGNEDNGEEVVDVVGLWLGAVVVEYKEGLYACKYAGLVDGTIEGVEDSTLGMAIGALVGAD